MSERRGERVGEVARSVRGRDAAGVTRRELLAGAAGVAATWTLPAAVMSASFPATPLPEVPSFDLDLAPDTLRRGSATACGGIVSIDADPRAFGFRLVSTAPVLRGGLQRDRPCAVARGVPGPGGGAPSLELLRSRGVRVIDLQPRRPLVSGAPLLATPHGLTPEGFDMLAEAGELRLLVDLRLLSTRALEDAIVASRRPCVASGGSCAAVGGGRGLGDRALRRLAEAGGVIGLTMDPRALGGSDPARLVVHAEHVVSQAGEDAVALCSAVPAWLADRAASHSRADIGDAVRALAQAGWSARRIEKIASANALRVLADVLG